MAITPPEIAMRSTAVLAAVLLAAAPVAFAEGGSSPNDPSRTLWERHQQDLANASQLVPVQAGGPGSWNGPPRECWNPRAGHYEGVRENEFQNDLDYSQCRVKGGYYGADRYGNAPRYDERAYATGQRECWNPRARHFEGVREGEFQDDLDYSRCRVVRDVYVEPSRRSYYYGR
jgi:hypothetical protein